MLERENNDGANPPARPKSNIQELNIKYPCAAAYLQAESWSRASNDVKGTTGDIAKEKIIND